MFVPLISLFLIWQARHRIAEANAGNSWWSLAVIAAGLFLYRVGELATLYVLQHVSLWTVIVGLVIASIGVRGTRTTAISLSYLLTSIPLPMFLYASLSSQLQLWSSAFGSRSALYTACGRDGVSRWQCDRSGAGPTSSHRSLQRYSVCASARFPCAALSLFLKDRMWKRVMLVLSSIPISIVVNGFRTGTIGVLIEWYGQGAVGGFYNLFKGWVLFMASLGLLILEMWVLTRMEK